MFLNVSAHNKTHLECAVLCTGVKLEVIDADSCNDMAFPSGVTGAVGEHHLIVALTCSQQTQVLMKYDTAYEDSVNKLNSNSF